MLDILVCGKLLARFTFGKACGNACRYVTNSIYIKHVVVFQSSSRCFFSTTNTQNNRFSQLPRNITCWMHHLKLGPFQADPPKVKLRAATGFDAADYLLANYWVWAKLLENLAMIGYDAWHIYLNHRSIFSHFGVPRTETSETTIYFLVSSIWFACLDM